MSASTIYEAIKNCAFVGADDGYDSQKVKVLYKGRTSYFRIPSFVAPGAPSRSSLDGAETDLFGYRTTASDGSEVLYTVGDEQDNIESTDSANFMTSPAARVLLYHSVRAALAEVGYNGTDPVYCYTGLPVETYYLGNKPNPRNLNAKLANISASKGGFSIEPLDSGLGPMPKIQFLGAQPEAISAWYAYALSLGDDLSLTPIEERANVKMVVVDWGGRTIDIIPMYRGSPSFADKRSLHDRGAIRLAALLKEEIILHRPDIELIENMSHRHFRNALITGRLAQFAEEYDIQPQLDSALERYRTEVAPEVARCLSKLTNYTHVMFTGGAASLVVGDQHERFAPRLMKTIDTSALGVDSAFMNAEGFCLQAIAAARHDAGRNVKKSA